MQTTTSNNIKLGSFVITGLLLLVLLLYLIGRNLSLFGNGYQLKSRFSNVQGLVTGNNVRYSGIQVGTVKYIDIINDTTIEVTMVIDHKMALIIKKKSIVSIATDGLVGDKVVNISPSKESSEFALEGDLLLSKRPINTDEVINTLSKTNNDISEIASNLKITIKRLNNSNVIWDILNDKLLHKNIVKAVSNIQKASTNAVHFVSTIDTIVADISNGKGTVGEILTTDSLSHNLTQAVQKLIEIEKRTDTLLDNVNHFVYNMNLDVSKGRGTVNALLRDSLMVTKINLSLDNLAEGAKGFNQNMEALKSNFLFRGYFKKIEKSKQKK